MVLFKSRLKQENAEATAAHWDFNLNKLEAEKLEKVHNHYPQSEKMFLMHVFKDNLSIAYEKKGYKFGHVIIFQQYNSLFREEVRHAFRESGILT